MRPLLSGDTGRIVSLPVDRATVKANEAGGVMVADVAQ